MCVRITLPDDVVANIWFASPGVKATTTLPLFLSTLMFLTPLAPRLVNL